MHLLYPLALALSAEGQQLPQVVVVDDDQPIADTVCEVLDDEGISATICPYGRRALACIRKKQPKVILLDVQMPEMDGIEIFQHLRADPATQTIPVIFFTANDHRVRSWLPDYEAQGATLLPKPFDLQKLVDMVNRALAA